MPGASSTDRARPGWRAWLGGLPARCRTQWRLKAALAVGLSVLFCVPYFLIGNFPLRPVRTLPLTALDRWIGFHPEAWVWVYQSVYLPINLIPWLATRRADFRQFARGFAVVSAVSFATYLVLPIRTPRPPVENPTGMLRLLLAYDVDHNCLPSLHAGLLVYALCWARRAVGPLPRGLGTIAIVWAALILYATLATKEHYAVDIAAGAVLAIAADVLVSRRRVTGEDLSTAPVSCGTTSR